MKTKTAICWNHLNTDAEKMGIVILARNIAGEGDVEDQLEVKANP